MDKTSFNPSLTVLRRALASKEHPNRIAQKEDNNMSKPKLTNDRSASKRTYISQADIPKHTLEEAIVLAKALFENYNGESAPHELANALSVSPTSSGWQSLSGAGVAYGLTEGGYNATTIKLTELGWRIVAPKEEGDDSKAIQQAAMVPRIMKDFFQKYNRGKFPQESIGMNVLTAMGVPRERSKSVYDSAKANGILAKFITNTTTGLYVALNIKTAAVSAESDHPNGESSLETDDLQKQVPPIREEASSKPAEIKKTHVFITHGKNRSIVDQLKEILKFGKFEPVVAVEHETPSKPVSDKVLADMRSCFASVIHVESEQELLSADGAKVQRINENVLIEIGASMALYGHNFVLLVKKGIHLPSNLQGLYCCFYEGDKLDYEATMKLLKAFNEFK